MTGTEVTIIVAAVLLSIVWFWTLIDCAIRDHPREMDKLVWVAIIISTWIFGSAAYLGVWRKRTSPMR